MWHFCNAKHAPEPFKVKQSSEIRLKDGKLVCIPHAGPVCRVRLQGQALALSLIHISEPTRLALI
eukprot:13500127-Alexandrium_andersonii.AAC.1